MLFETFESRRLLSGAVTAVLAPNGTLTITGNGANNGIVVNGSNSAIGDNGAPAPGFIRVQSDAFIPGGPLIFPNSLIGDLFTGVNGGAFTDFDATQVQRINMNLNGGNDQAIFDELNGTEEISNRIVVTDNLGNDAYGIAGVDTNTLNVTTGAGIDFVTIDDGSGGTSNLIDVVTIATGAGDDTLLILGAGGSLYGSLAATMDGGNDLFAVDGATVIGGVNVNLGAGNDTAVLDQFIVFGNGSINGGTGNDVLAEFDIEGDGTGAVFGFGTPGFEVFI